MKRNKLMEECRKLITPEIRELVDRELKKINKGEITMKREILFRGKRIDNGEWIEGSLVQTLYNSYIVPFYDEFTFAPSFNAVIPETVGQFTGMPDRGKTPIFEGDILKLYLGQIVEVKFIAGCFSFYLNEKSKAAFDNLECGNSTKIGNIHDNPELLLKK